MKSFTEEFAKARARLKEEAGRVKEYLKGKILPGTEVYYTPKIKIEGSRNFKAKYRAHRKVRNAMAYRSRRINRMRAA